MINECNKIKMDKICRSCMCECEDMKNLFSLTNNEADDEGQHIRLADMLMACASVKVQTNDGLPILMCSQCEIKLCLAFNFKNLCEKTEATLRDLIKSEDDEIDMTTDLDIPSCNDSGDPDYDKKKKKRKFYTCNVCHKVLTSKKDLLSHMRRHDMEVDESVTSSAEQLKTYECKYCHKILTTAMGLKIHTRRHTGINLHTCNMCDKSYTKESHLKRHKQIHGKEVESPKSNEEKKTQIMECEFCDRKFKYRKSFNHHIRTEHGMSDDSDVPLSVLASKSDSNVLLNKDDKETIIITPEIPDIKPNKNTCHVCDAQFTRSNHLTRHMTLHRHQLIHKCDRCEKAFASLEFLKKHTQEDHIDRAYDCSICKKGFTRGEHLIRHLKIHVTSTPKESNLTCSICEKDFSRSDHLARHLKIHLQQDKRHACNDCGKTFNRLDNLKTHQRIHTGQKDTSKLHLCIYCGKEFNNSSNMIVHMRRHTGERPYKCSQCGKGFPRSHDLKCHERIHSGEKPYLCTLCGKSFNKSNKLLRHTRVHTGERPYVCNLCGRAFTQSNDLSLHVRRHTGSRPYACGVCPARFIQSGQLKAHRRSTGHWMETQPDLKGGHRVEPVIPLTEPVPIRFKTHGKMRKTDTDESKQNQEKDVLNNGVENINNSSTHNNIQIQPLIVDGNKILEQFHNAGFVTTVIQHNLNESVDGENKIDDQFDISEVKCETEISECHVTSTFETSFTSTSTTFSNAGYNYQSFG